MKGSTDGGDKQATTGRRGYTGVLRVSLFDEQVTTVIRGLPAGLLVQKVPGDEACLC